MATPGRGRPGADGTTVAGVSFLSRTLARPQTRKARNEKRVLVLVLMIVLVLVLVLVVLLLLVLVLALVLVSP